MCVVGATTATRATRPSESIRCATCRPNVVLPAAGVADARNASPGWEKTAAAAACCQARSGRVVGQGESTERGRLRTAPDGSWDPQPLRVRLLTPGDEALMERFMLFAGFPPDRELPPAARQMAHIRWFLDGWGRTGDVGVVAEEERPLGAAWTSR